MTRASFFSFSFSSSLSSRSPLSSRDLSSREGSDASPRNEMQRLPFLEGALFLSAEIYSVFIHRSSDSDGACTPLGIRNRPDIGTTRTSPRRGKFREFEKKKRMSARRDFYRIRGTSDVPVATIMIYQG